MHKEIMRMFELSGKTSLIIGGTRNLGFDMACTLAGAGSDLIVTSRSHNRAEESAEKLRSKYKIDVLPFELDHTDAGQVSDIVIRTKQWKGHIDILINNAGGGSGQPPSMLFEKSPTQIADLINKNLTGTLYCCREVGEVMSQQGHGKIVNIASIAGIIGMTRDLVAYLSPMGIYVNCISHGGFDRNLPENFVKRYSDRTPLGRMGRDGIDINGAVLYLVSPASDCVTGHNLVVDGDFSIWQ